MPELSPQSRAAIDRIEPEVLLGVPVNAPTLAGNARRQVQASAEGARAIGFELQGIVSELGGSSVMEPGAQTAFNEAESFISDTDLNLRIQKWQIADGLSRVARSIGAKILEGEHHVRLIPREVTI